MGLDLGLEQAGIAVLLASEIDKFARLTIQHNRPNCPLIGDLRDYSALDILAIAGLKTDEDLDLIVGGPPCQAFSTAGKRKGFNDERGNVFLKFLDLITEIRPRYAVIENVRGLLSAPLSHRPHSQRGPGFPPLQPEEKPGGALRHVIQRLEAQGYGVSFNLYNSANFGTPQIRERIVILCHRDGEELPYLEPSHSGIGQYRLPPWSTFQVAVADLPPDCHDHINFPERRLQYYKLLKPGQNWRSLPFELQLEAMGKAFYSGGGRTGFFRRLAWDTPSPTLVTHPAMPATDLAHPCLDRPLSIQEYKRIQQFPDDWLIAGGTLDQYKQLGNAVPVGLGAAIGRLILKHLQGEPIQTYWQFQYSRYHRCDHHAWKNKYMSPHQQLQLSLS
ncbi:MAG: DNA cytosine methyltransferase [Oscillatoriales cyanobacterium RM2_1_1]|nr:DNA cytosine methyltransferase [Oscillatoriales cyanobacterium SM2_3_0]NJO45960.1 DNA cytosine methyltransferase [Oscillatoriales cyanobacterium RM2_1_1]